MSLCCSKLLNACRRFKSIGQYPSWQLLWAEWREVIVFRSAPGKRTVPMETLEKDLAEGRQKKKSPSVPWRNISNRNAIRDRKIIIHGALQAQHDGKDVNEYMSSLQKAAEASLEAARKRPGNSATLMTCIKSLIEHSPSYLSPIEFEKEVLKWQHTPQALKAAASKQQKAPYGPVDVEDQ